MFLNNLTKFVTLTKFRNGTISTRKKSYYVSRIWQITVKEVEFILVRLNNNSIFLNESPQLIMVVINSVS